MKHVYHRPLFVFFLILYGIAVTAQVPDGAMRISFRYESVWAETGDDIFPDADEFNNEGFVRDYPDLDGQGFFSTGVRSWSNGLFACCGPYSTSMPGGNWVRDFTYGTFNSPAFTFTPNGLQARQVGWEDDCFDCCSGTVILGICLASCSSCPGSLFRNSYQNPCPCSTGNTCGCSSDDQFCDRQMNNPNFLPFRDAPPYQWTFKGLTRTGDPGYNGGCGSDDVGMGYSTFWTSPCPDTLKANRTHLCEPGYVTLYTSGAVFGGEYVWFENGNFLQITGLSDSFLTVYVANTSTYRVYTRNNGQNSWSYREITITVGQPLINNITATDPTCNGTSTGTITVTASGGNGPLQYSINNGATWQNSGNFTNLPQGIYFVKIRDNFCTIPQFGVTIQLKDPPLLASNIASVTNVLCNGLNNGKIDLTVSGGTPPYSYNWTQNGSPFATTEDLINIPGGNYAVTVTDTKGCITTQNVTLTQPAAPLNISGNVTNILCNNGSTGSIDITVSGGTPPYTFLWSNGATTEDITGLSAGAYNVLVTDLNGCQRSAVFTVSAPAPLKISFINITPVLCFGQSTGGAEVVASGGTANYSYAWSNGSTGSQLTNVPSGKYIVTVTDANACTAVDSVVISQNPKYVISLENIQHLRCYGDSLGAVAISLNGGVAPFTFKWTNVTNGVSYGTSEDINNVPAGTYRVVVSDANGCIDSAEYTVTGPQTPLTVSAQGFNISCFGGSDGSITTQVTGGTPPYSYNWSNFSTSSSLSGLTANSYQLTVTDAKNCTSVTLITLTQPQPFSVTDTVTNLKCNGDSNGSIILKSVAGGNGGYTFVWSTSDTSQNLFNLPAGIYNVTITDNRNCSLVKSYEVIQPAPILSSVAGNNPDCYDNATGFAVVSYSGGTPPYTFTWNTNPVQTGVMAINLYGDATYVVTISDARGCTKTDSTRLVRPSQIVVTTFPKDVSCFSGDDGQVLIKATGGTGIYSYYVNGIYQADSIYLGLVAGKYTVVVEDNNNCKGVATFNITQPQAFFVSAGEDRISLRKEPVKLVAKASSSNGILGYLWTPSSGLNCDTCAEVIASPDTTTDYVLRVMDGDSCFNYDTVRVIVKLAPQAFIPTAFTPNGDGLNDYFNFDILGAKTIEVKIYDRWGNLIYDNPNQPNGTQTKNAWDGTFKGAKVVMETYVYRINVTFWDDTETSFTGTVAVMR
ncbi:MAG: gliding motility-associated C-terminal domain-containing protein [Chitinophagales bacterium]|nr:gliding motility-associated C-terminal domain-containing protein [Chitinophagales bacterium]